MKFSSKRPDNRLFSLLVALFPFILALSVFFCLEWGGNHSIWMERNYSNGIYPFIASGFSSISALLPFSLWDLFWVLFVSSILVGLVLVLFRKIRVGMFFLRLFQMLALLYALFYLVWGFNYMRPDMATRLGWKKEKADEAVFRTVLDSLIDRTNRTYHSILTVDYPLLDRLVEKSYQKNRDELGINYPNGVRRPKRMIFNSLFAKSGVSGYFGPFFNEVHINYYLLPMEYPYILAHEKAHQFGITNEAEANFAAFVVCTTSDDVRLQYSGYVNILLYFISESAGLKDANRYIQRIDKSVIRDLRFQRRHWQGLRNKALDQIQTKANNAYLKTNHIEAGVDNYNQVVDLVINWYRNQKN